MILYFGDDIDFAKRMEGFYKSSSLMEDLEVKTYNFSLESVVNNVIKDKPQAMIFDFSKKITRIDSIFTIINYLKKSKDYGGIPIFTLFSSKEETFSNRYLFGLGLNYPFVRGAEESILFGDIHYLIFEADTPFAQFARAQMKSLPYHFGAMAHVYGFTDQTVLIESDINCQESDLKSIDMFLIDGKSKLDLRTQKNFDVGITSSFLSRSEFEIPFLGPWDDPMSDLVHKDSYETWLSENSETIKPKDGRILIVSNRSEDYALAGRLACLFNFDVYVSSGFEDTKLLIESYLFDVVYYRIDALKDGGDNNFDNLFRLTNAVKNLYNSTQSIFVIFNSPSRTNALKKAIDYDQALAVPDEITIDNLEKFTDVFQRKGIKKTCETSCFKITNPSSNAELNIAVEVTSMTEHEVTFHSKEDIPMYSVLSLDVPTELLLLIVPPFHSLEPSAKGNHYMGFIVGGSEQDAEVLRNFVNRVIVHGLENFSLDELSEIDENDSDTVDTIEAVPATKEKAAEQDKKAEEVKKRKTNKNGKSKL